MKYQWLKLNFAPKTMKNMFFQNLFGEVIKTIDTDQETEGLLFRFNSRPHTSKKLGQKHWDIIHFCLETQRVGSGGKVAGLLNHRLQKPSAVYIDASSFENPLRKLNF